MKTCRKCEQEKELSEFSKDSRVKSGYSCYCKKCECERLKTWRKKNKEKISAYNKLDYVKAKRKAWTRAWLKTDTGKILGRRADRKYFQKIKNELSDGYIKKHINKVYGLDYKYITAELIIGNRERIKFNRLKGKLWRF